MKKLLLLAAVSALGFTAMAQTEKGKLILGGGFNFIKTTNEQNISDVSNKTTSFNIAPSIGYFVSDNFAVGTEIGYFYSKYKQTMVFSDNQYVYTDVKQHAYIISPFARYYAKVTEQIKFFGHLSVPINFATSKYKLSGGSDYIKSGTNNNFGVSLSPGFVFFPNPKLGIEFSVSGISYNDYRYKDDTADINNTKVKTFSIGANLASPNIGVQYYF